MRAAQESNATLPGVILARACPECQTQPDVLYNLEGGTEAWIKAGEPVETV